MAGKSGSHSLWGILVKKAMDDIKDRFVEKMVDSFKLNTERPRIDKGWLNEETAFTHTLYLCKINLWRFWKELSPSRNILRITDVGEHYDQLHWHDWVNRGTFADIPFFNQYKGSEPLKCELFSVDSRLRDIAQFVLGPLAKRLGYSHVEYIDMSHDRSAYYPGERPKLPKARVVRNA